MTDRRSLETDQVVQQMKQLAARYHAKRLSLFGSRARGDAGPGSDYDFALWGVPKDLRVSLRAGAEDIPSLLKLDLVFISDTVTPEFLANIRKDEIVIMDKLESKLLNFKRALARLQDGLLQYEQNPWDIARDGIIQRFEFTYELAWKAAREYLTEQGFADLNSPRSVLRQAVACGLITGSEDWTALMEDRSSTSHVYDEGLADEIAGRIRDRHVKLFAELLEKMAG